MTKGVIFDFDGTLLDTTPEWKVLGEKYLKSKGIVPESNINEILDPMSLEESGEYFIEKYGFTLSVKEIIEEINLHIADKYINHFQLKPYVLDYLKKLKSEGKKMCIATATEHSLAVAAVKRIGIEDYFEFVLTCGEVGYSKKHPNIYVDSASKLGFGINEVVVFEDTLSCIETAKAAGFKVVAVDDISSGKNIDSIKSICDHYIYSYKELL